MGHLSKNAKQQIILGNVENNAGLQFFSFKLNIFFYSSLMSQNMN